MNSLRLWWAWPLAALASAVLSVLLFCPAAWLAAVLERQSGGRLTLGDPQGTLWRGSAFIGAASGGAGAVAPLLPGRFAWRLSPAVLWGEVRARLENPAALSQPVDITGGWSQWRVGSAAMLLPAQRLAAFGAPLNTIQPGGRFTLSWGPLQVTRQAGGLALLGTMTLRMDDVSSRLSPVRPLGAYTLALDWRGGDAELALHTERGPMLLHGAGTLHHGRLRFSGAAEAAPGQEEKLANLLNLLGQRRSDGDRNVIALEFK